MKFSGFYQHPTDSEIVIGTNNIELEQRLVSIEYNYIIYTFNAPTIKKQDKIKYIVFTVLNNAKLTYLSLYAYTFEKIEFTIYNINYMKEEILNKTALGRHIGAFAFILENEGQEKNKLIRLKLKKEYSPEIQMVAGGFKERPTKQEELENGVSSELKLKSLTKDENYNIYEYSLENPEINKQKYIVIGMLLSESLDFISFYIGHES